MGVPTLFSASLKPARRHPEGRMPRGSWGKRFRDWECAEDYMADDHAQAHQARQRYGYVERGVLLGLHVARIAARGPERYAVNCVQCPSHACLATLRAMFGTGLHGRRSWGVAVG